MKLWLLRPREGLSKDDDLWEPWYDKAFGFVVRAETEERAREMAQAEGGNETGIYPDDKKAAWTDAKYSTCVELTADGPEELVMEDFHAA